MNINGISKLSSIENMLPSVSEKNQQESAVSFSEFLNQALGKVSDLENQSKEKTFDLLTGDVDSIHEVMIAAEKADVALQLTLQIRNKVLDAYQEIMRMQI